VGILNVPAELQLAMLAAVRFANQASLGQKGVRFSTKICRRVAYTPPRVAVKFRSDKHPLLYEKYKNPLTMVKIASGGFLT
jgi:hypothetical protein